MSRQTEATTRSPALPIGYQQLLCKYGILRCIIHTAVADRQMRSGENRQTQVTIYNSLPIGSAT
jgi:hypothetical protein